MFRGISFGILAIPALVLSVSATAQSTGSIRGTVTDATGSAIANASFSLTETNTQLSRTVVSNNDGIFVFSDLPIGNYTLTVTAAGFSKGSYSGITLVTGHVVDVPVTLSVGAADQQVTVSADSETIQTSTSAVQQSVTEEQIQNLPLNGRNPLQLTTLVPGTVLTTVGTESGQEDNTGLSVNGLRGDTGHLHAGWSHLREPLLRFGADAAQSRCTAGVHHPDCELRFVAWWRGRAGADDNAFRHQCIAWIGMGVSA